MAKRPLAPRPRPTARSPLASEQKRDSSPGAPPRARNDSTRSGASRTVGRPAPEVGETAAARPGDRPGPKDEGDEGSDRGRVVQAAERFRSLVAGRPWRRRRRAIIATVAAVGVLLVAALAAAIWLPALRLQEVTVSGHDYVEEDQVRSGVEARLGDSVLLLPTTTLAEELTEVPGVRSAEVERRWPDGAHVTVTEREPLAAVTGPDGSSAVLDEDGVELPDPAGEGDDLVPLKIDPASGDPDGAAQAMVEVLAGLPDPLREALVEVTAASRSDVTLDLSLEDGETKTVVWGDAQDAELKAEVVQVLISESGTVIDVSSPVAPVTR